MTAANPQSGSDTPRTAKALKLQQGLFRVAAETNGFAAFTRTLERENARLQEALTAANHGDVPAGWDAAIARAEKAERELAATRKELEEAKEVARQLESDLTASREEGAQARHDADRASEQLEQRVSDYLNEKACCNGHECACGGLTRLQHYVQEEAGTQMDALHHDLDELKCERDSANTELDTIRAKCRDWQERYIRLVDITAKDYIELSARLPAPPRPDMKQGEIMVIDGDYDKDHPKKPQ
jgi:chromosome segregation ATPase